jgi:hypothetical protein
MHNSSCFKLVSQQKTKTPLFSTHKNLASKLSRQLQKFTRKKALKLAKVGGGAPLMLGVHNNTTTMVPVTTYCKLCFFVLGLGNTTGTPNPIFRGREGGRGPTPKSVVFTSPCFHSKGNWPSYMCGREQKNAIISDGFVVYYWLPAYKHTGPCRKDQGSKGSKEGSEWLGYGLWTPWVGGPSGELSFCSLFRDLSCTLFDGGKVVLCLLG